jgi:putative membrane protein
MFKNFTDHAANERTFLAWIRTALAIVALGFVIAKFDLFFQISSLRETNGTVTMVDETLGNIAGLALIILGTVLVAISTFRFRNNTKRIESKETHTNTETRVELALGALLFLLGCMLFVFLWHIARS